MGRFALFFLCFYSDLLSLSLNSFEHATFFIIHLQAARLWTALHFWSSTYSLRTLRPKEKKARYSAAIKEKVADQTRRRLGACKQREQVRGLIPAFRKPCPFCSPLLSQTIMHTGDTEQCEIGNIVCAEFENKYGQEKGTGVEKRGRLGHAQVVLN